MIDECPRAFALARDALFRMSRRTIHHQAERNLRPHLTHVGCGRLEPPLNLEDPVPEGESLLADTSPSDSTVDLGSLGVRAGQEGFPDRSNKPLTVPYEEPCVLVSGSRLVDAESDRYLHPGDIDRSRASDQISDALGNVDFWGVSRFEQDADPSRLAQAHAGTGRCPVSLVSLS